MSKAEELARQIVDRLDVLSDDLTIREYARRARSEVTALLEPHLVGEDDKVRLDWLEDAVSGGHVESAFEMDGGIHLTVCEAGDLPIEIREKNTLREAIDAARSAAPPKGEQSA